MSVGSDGPGSSTDYFPRVLNAFFGTKFKIVRGYKGRADITLAIERGELDGLCFVVLRLHEGAEAGLGCQQQRTACCSSSRSKATRSSMRKGMPKVVDLAKHG